MTTVPSSTEVNARFSTFLIGVAGAVIDYDSLVAKHSKVIQFARDNSTHTATAAAGGGGGGGGSGVDMKKMPSFVSTTQIPVNSGSVSSKGGGKPPIAGATQSVTNEPRAPFGASSTVSVGTASSTQPPSRRVSNNDSDEPFSFGASSSYAQAGRKNSEDRSTATLNNSDHTSSGNNGSSSKPPLTAGDGISTSISNSIPRLPISSKDGTYSRTLTSTSSTANGSLDDPMFREQLANFLFSVDEVMTSLKTLPFQRLLVDLNLAIESLLDAPAPQMGGGVRSGASSRGKESFTPGDLPQVPRIPRPHQATWSSTLQMPRRRWGAQ